MLFAPSPPPFSLSSLPHLFSFYLLFLLYLTPFCLIYTTEELLYVSGIPVAYLCVLNKLNPILYIHLL